ncbi:MAG: UDP-2,3-diacylglucosamine diphosphatase LpxI [bacterium]
MMNKIGLIAGSGRFPVLFAKEAKALGFSVIAIGIKGTTSPELERYAHFNCFRLGQMSKPLEILKTAGVKKVVMAGGIPHFSIFGGILPDLRAAKFLMRLRDKRALSILGALAEELALDGMELVSSATFLEHLLPEPGLLAGPAPSPAVRKDISLGWKTAKALSAQDVGLTVVVKDTAVVAVEAMEGTDACILRAGEIFNKSRLGSGQKPVFPGLTVVKVARPGQDMRFDLPVIGTGTLAAMRNAGAGTMAVEARSTLILEREQFLREAGREKITVIALLNDPVSE